MVHFFHPIYHMVPISRGHGYTRGVKPKFVHKNFMDIQSLDRINSETDSEV